MATDARTSLNSTYGLSRGINKLYSSLPLVVYNKLAKLRSSLPLAVYNREVAKLRSSLPLAVYNREVEITKYFTNKIPTHF